jgi:hypothetical protein
MQSIGERAKELLPIRFECPYHQAMKARSHSSTILFFCIAALIAVSSAGAQTISVSASPSVITNAGEESTITLTISPPSSVVLSVQFFLTGTAGYGHDYVLTGEFNRAGQIIVPRGQSTVTVTLHSFYDDDRPGTEETAIFNLHSGRRYSVGSPSRAQVTIENID